MITRKERIERAAAPILAAMIGSIGPNEILRNDIVQLYIDTAVFTAVALIQKIDSLGIEGESDGTHSK